METLQKHYVRNVADLVAMHVSPSLEGLTQTRPSGRHLCLDEWAFPGILPAIANRKASNKDARLRVSWEGRTVVRAGRP
jgi:hypothetical protein